MGTISPMSTVPELRQPRRLGAPLAIIIAMAAMMLGLAGTASVSEAAVRMKATVAVAATVEVGVGAAAVAEHVIVGVDESDSARGLWANALPRARTAGFCVNANTAEAVADAALATGRTSGAAAELRVGGQVFTDVSTGGAPRVLNRSVQEALDSVPLAQRAPWHGACAEMGCLSQALDAGVNPAGGSIRAVAIGTSNPGHDLPKAICSSCSAVLDDFGVER